MSILGSVLGSLTGQGGGGLMQLASSLLQKAGGIQGLSKILASGGLGSAVSSWIGTGQNQAVSGSQLGQALQQGGLGNLLQEAARKMGLDQGQLHDQLAQVLPHVVDHLTPNGQAPADDGGGMDLSALEGLAGKLFG